MPSCINIPIKCQICRAFTPLHRRILRACLHTFLHWCLIQLCVLVGNRFCISLIQLIIRLLCRLCIAIQRKSCWHRSHCDCQCHCQCKAFFSFLHSIPPCFAPIYTAKRIVFPQYTYHFYYILPHPLFSSALLSFLCNILLFALYFS